MIGSQELGRFQKFMQEDGYKRHIIETTSNFGLIKNDSGDWLNGKITQGSVSGTIDIGEVSAIDQNGDFITKGAQTNVAVIQDDQWRWVAVSYATTKNEEGTISVGSNGAITGVGTKFTEVLRGQPNIASSIKITTSTTSNTSVYEVLEVISDTEAVLQGTFTNESDLNWAVVGSFDPGVSPTLEADYPFEYDSASIEYFLMVPQTEPPTLPFFLIEGEQFLLGRVRGRAGTVEIEDWRQNYVYKSKDESLTNTVGFSANPLIAVESVKFKPNNSSLMDNIVQVGWGMRSSNYTIDGNSNTLTINSGEGGVFKSTADFTNGDFDGWRVYSAFQEEYSTVVTSSRTTTQINLLLDTINGSEFGGEISVVPPSNNITITSTAFDNDGISVQLDSSSNRVDTFLMRDGVGYIELPVFNDPSVYQLSYGYSTGSSGINLSNFPDDTVGYYDESSFQENGSLNSNPVDRTRVPNTTGRVTLQLSNNSYSNFKSRVDPGDAFGAEVLELDNASPIVEVETGDDLQYQLVDAGITLTIDHFISLETVNASNGNRFLFRINKGDGTLDRGSFSLKFVQDYVDLVDTGTELLDIDDTYEVYINDSNSGNLLIEFIFDGTNWLPQSYVSAYTAPRRDGGVTLTGVQDYSTAFDLSDEGNTALTHKGYVDSGLTSKLDSSKIDLATGSNNIRFKTIDIGAWNMDTTAAVGIAHGLGSNWLNVASINAMIYGEDEGPGQIVRPLVGAESNTDGDSSGTITLNSLNITLLRLDGGIFDNALFNDTSINRGKIIITYTV